MDPYYDHNVHSILFSQDDPKQRKPDITTAGEQLGWKPVVWMPILYFFACVYALFNALLITCALPSHRFL